MSGLVLNLCLGGIHRLIPYGVLSETAATKTDSRQRNHQLDSTGLKIGSNHQSYDDFHNCYHLIPI